MSTNPKWYLQHRLWLDWFVLVNLAFLGPDIFLAHSTNYFRNAWEYVPLVFSLAAPLMLLMELAVGGLVGRRLGLTVGWSSVVVGVMGLVRHLESHFFRDYTLDSLVYTAPFAAPLAYTGLGLLTIMNRTVDADTPDWPYWVLLLAWGGFVGNFIFSLADHAQNGFFHPAEWVAVAASALAVGFLLVPFLVAVERGFLRWCAAILSVQALVGIVGFYYHTIANLDGPSESVLDNFVYGAPSLAPLLFPNLVLLASIGLWTLRRHVR